MSSNLWLCCGHCDIDNKPLFSFINSVESNCPHLLDNACEAANRSDHSVQSPDQSIKSVASPALQPFYIFSEAQELPNGFAIRFLNEPGKFMEIAKLIENDSLVLSVLQLQCGSGTTPGTSVVTTDRRRGCEGTLASHSFWVRRREECSQAADSYVCGRSLRRGCRGNVSADT